MPPCRARTDHIFKFTLHDLALKRRIRVDPVRTVNPPAESPGRQVRLNRRHSIGVPLVVSLDESVVGEVYPAR